MVAGVTRPLEDANERQRKEMGELRDRLQTGDSILNQVMGILTSEFNQGTIAIENIPALIGTLVSRREGVDIEALPQGGGAKLELLRKLDSALTKGDERAETEQQEKAAKRGSTIPRVTFQHIIGVTESLPINYLERSLRAARSVCRVNMRLPNGTGNGFATGVLVAPNLLLTVNHGLPNGRMALRSLAEFDLEDDIRGERKVSRLFSLLPDQLFFTDRELDFTLVAVEPHATDGTPLSNYDFVPALQDAVHFREGGYVHLIYHQAGKTKRVSLFNQFLWSNNNYIHYEKERQLGSAGSPVFSADWSFVALHHSSVPRTDSEGRRLKRDGTPYAPGESDDEVWIGGEGVRMSAIFRPLAESQTSAAHEALQLLRNAVGVESVPPG